MKIALGLLVAGLVVCVVALYGLFGHGTTDGALDAEDHSVLADAQPVDAKSREYTGEATLSTISQLATSLECRISYAALDLTEPIIGTYFTHQGQVRGDFEILSPELGPMVSSIIETDEQIYSWSTIAGQSYGVKSVRQNDATVRDERLREPVPVDSVVSYRCTEWTNVDGSIFVPPSNVLFQDLDEVLGAGIEIGTVYEEGEF